jgi:DNA-binding transcriptional LysR family regulator
MDNAMDLELARTFLEIVRRGSFVAAAEGLHVTQTAVTARIHNLETLLHCRLLVRNRAGAQLTPDGARFVAYASELVSTWEAARRDLPLPDGYADLLRLGGEISLHNPLLQRWATRLRPLLGKHALRIDVGESATLQAALRQGHIDAALVYQPDYSPGVQVEQLMEEKLIQVGLASNPEPYIFVDWGADYRRQHDLALPGLAHSPVAFNLGLVALQYIQECGGRAYFRSRAVKRYLDQGQLVRIPNTPEFTYPVYLVSARGKDGPLQQAAMAMLRDIVKEQQVDWTQGWL